MQRALSRAWGHSYRIYFFVAIRNNHGRQIAAPTKKNTRRCGNYGTHGGAYPTRPLSRRCRRSGGVVCRDDRPRSSVVIMDCGVCTPVHTVLNQPFVIFVCFVVKKERTANAVIKRLRENFLPYKNLHNVAKKSLTHRVLCGTMMKHYENSHKTSNIKQTMPLVLYSIIYYYLCILNKEYG